MISLPKGNPVYENVAVNRIKVPEMLETLKESGFSGYLSFCYPNSEGILLFEGGKMISAFNEKGDVWGAGLEAIVAIFNAIFSEGGRLNVYRLSRDLTMSIHALLHGEVLYKAQDLAIIDIRMLLAKFKSQGLNGCLRIYTDDRSSLIFYKNGSPIGFFHDGSQEIETSASESQKIAGLPGAKIDVLSTKSVEELMMYDLLEMVNVRKLWETARDLQIAEIARGRIEAEEKARKRVDAELRALEDDLKEVATAYLGKAGAALVGKEIANAGGLQAFLQDEGVEKILKALEKGAKLLTSMTKVQEMIDTIRDEVASRTKQLRER